MLKLCVYIPEAHLDSVKRALFSAGAGRQGEYDSCCWQTLGQGQFRPLENSQPFIGSKGRIEKVSEYRVEMLVKDSLKQAVVEALIEAHPYEVPAFDLLRLETIE